jgi:hypothetical protein
LLPDCEKLRKCRRKQTLDFTGRRPKSQEKAGKKRAFHAFFSPFLAGFACFDAEGKCAGGADTPSTMVLPNGRSTKVDGGCGQSRNSTCCL